MVLPLLPLLAIGSLVGGYGACASRPDIMLPGGASSYPPPLRESKAEREERRLQYLDAYESIADLKRQQFDKLRRR